MKQAQLALSICIVAFFIACKDNTIEPIAFDGRWSSAEIHVNGMLQGEDISKTTHLGINKNNTYFKNYVVGSWTYANDKLTLIPNPDLAMKTMQYEVINISDTTLILKITLTERDYSRDFAGIEADELITVTEKYIKHQ